MLLLHPHTTGNSDTALALSDSNINLTNIMLMSTNLRNSRLRELSAEGALNADWTVIAQHGDFPTIWDAERVSLFMNRYKKRLFVFLSESAKIIGVLMADPLAYASGIGRSKNTTSVEYLDVDDRTRGVGIGGQLLQYFLAAMRKEGLVKVGLDSLNGAVPFYRRFGFNVNDHWSTPPGFTEMFLNLADAVRANKLKRRKPTWSLRDVTSRKGRRRL